MTTFNSFMRNTNAALNRMERAHNRRVRQVDWSFLCDEPPPALPPRSHALEQRAALKLAHYRPSFFDSLFKMTGKRRRRLEEKVVTGQQMDTAQFVEAETAYRKVFNEWEFLNKMAEGVLHRSASAYRDAVEHFDPFSAITALGLSMNFKFYADHIIADLAVQADEVLPKEVYQDHVCSCVLRVGRELLALLPVEFVIVNVVGDLLNSATGRIELQTVVSAAMFPEALECLQFDSLNPSDSMRNFVHRMEFSKTEGLRPVQPLTVEDLTR